MDTDLGSPVRAAISREVKTAVSSSPQELLSSITTLMDTRLALFQTNIQQTQQEISQTQMTKIEETMTDSYTFQRKGNENQYRHEVKVLSKPKEPKSCLEVPDLSYDAVQSAKTKIAEGIDIVRERQLVN